MGLGSRLADRISPVAYQEASSEEFWQAVDKNRKIKKLANVALVGAVTGGLIAVAVLGVRASDRQKDRVRDERVAKIEADVHALYPSASNIHVVLERDQSSNDQGSTPALPGSVAFEQRAANGPEICTSLTAEFNEVGPRMVGPVACRAA